MVPQEQALKYVQLDDISEAVFADTFPAWALSCQGLGHSFRNTMCQ